MPPKGFALRCLSGSSCFFRRCYGREFCGRTDHHPYELFLQLEDIEHRTTRVKRPHQGRNMKGRTPLAVFTAGLPKQALQKPTEKPLDKKEKSPLQKIDNQLAV